MFRWPWFRKAETADFAERVRIRIAAGKAACQAEADHLNRILAGGEPIEIACPDCGARGYQMADGPIYSCHNPGDVCALGQVFRGERRYAPDPYQWLDPWEGR